MAEKYIIMQAVPQLFHQMEKIAECDHRHDAEIIAMLWSRYHGEFTEYTINTGVYDGETGDLLCGFNRGKRIDLGK